MFPKPIVENERYAFLGESAKAFSFPGITVSVETGSMDCNRGDLQALARHPFLVRQAESRSA